jgi:hypothetical protein
VLQTLPGPSAGDLALLQRDLHHWLGAALASGLDDESIIALVAAGLRDAGREQEHFA